jgi:endonuclease/exonuclease/phosphatase family metal-dependent hydrolase
MLVFLTLLSLCAAAVPQSIKPVDVTVMTRNLYLGVDLAPILEAVQTGGDVAQASLDAIAIAIGPNFFPLRAPALAKEINDEKPDLISLQEVTTLIAGASELNFKSVLLPQIPDYEVAIETVEATFVTPGVGSLSTSNVILKRKGARMVVSNPQSGYYVANAPGFLGQPIKRNWQTVDATIGGKSFVFLNTHLEAYADEVSTAQALELLAGPLNTEARLIAAGDFNSEPGLPYKGAYKALTNNKQKGRLNDVARLGPTCCRANLLTVPERADKEAKLDERNDFVFTNSNAIKLISAKRTGVNQVNGLYPSDHIGVVAKLRFT